MVLLSSPPSCHPFSLSFFLSFFHRLHPSRLLAFSLEIDAKCFIKNQYSSPCFARGVPFSYGLAILPARISPYPSRLTLFFISTFLKKQLKCCLFFFCFLSLLLPSLSHPLSVGLLVFSLSVKSLYWRKVVFNR